VCVQEAAQTKQTGLLIVTEGVRLDLLLGEPRPRGAAQLIPSPVHKPGPRQFSQDLALVGTVGHGRGRAEAQAVRCPAEVCLQDLTNVHTARHTQRVQDDLHGRAIGEIGHILDGHHCRDDPLVPMAAGHLVTLGQLAPLRDADAHHLLHARREVAVLISREDVHVHDFALFAVRQP